MPTSAAYTLIRNTASIHRRRRIQLAVAIPLPALLVTVCLAAFGGLSPLAVAVAATLVLAVAVAGHRRGLSLEAVAHAIDRHLGAKDRFLTLATIDRGACALGAELESDAMRCAARCEPEAIVPPVAWAKVIAGSCLLAATVAVSSALFSAAPPELAGETLARLEVLALAVEQQSPSEAERKLARDVLQALPALRDPAARSEMTRDQWLPIFDAYGHETGTIPGAWDFRGAYGGRGGESTGKGSGHSGGEGAGEIDTAAAAERLVQEFERILSEAESRGGGTRSTEPKQKGRGSGTGGSSSGESEAGVNPETAGSGVDPVTGDATRPEARSDDDTGAEPEETPARPSEGGQLGAAGAEARLEGGASRSQTRQADRYYKPGEEPVGWRIEGGRYVRVWVPPGVPSEEFDRVREPGGVHVQTPHGGAPLPEEVARRAQREPRVPLEYRKLLSRRSARERVTK